MNQFEALAIVPEAAKRWRPIRSVSEKIDRLQREQAECRERVEQLRAAVPTAERRDRERRAEALTGGGKMPGRREVDEARLELPGR